MIILADITLNDVAIKLREIKRRIDVLDYPSGSRTKFFRLVQKVGEAIAREQNVSFEQVSNGLSMETILGPSATIAFQDLCDFVIDK